MPATTCLIRAPMTPSAPPQPSVAQIRQIARKLRETGRFMDAAKVYGVAAKRAPQGNAGLFMAYCLRDAGDQDLALKAFEHYAQNHPDDFDGHVGLGLFCKKTGAYDLAVTALRRALDLRSDIPVRNTLITCLLRSGHEDEAKAEGITSLQTKHAHGLEFAQTNAFAQMGLCQGGRSFDPDHPERNVIAFSLWGDRPEYVTGALINAQIARFLYMRWTARFYCDPSVPPDAINALRTFGAQVVMMDRPEQQRYRPMWRFFASDDPNVNVFVCRDTDSRLNAKELLAVMDWIESGKSFHVMRDHVMHHELILAGMWGGKAGVLPSIQSYLDTAPAYFDNKFADQAFLGECVWPMVWKDTLVHDSAFGFPETGGFPTGYDLPGETHVGGGVKSMPHWSKFIHMPE